MRLKSAVKKINQRGVLLVFPVTNRKEPNSLWSELYPGVKMRWEWDDEGDNRVADTWLLMKRLSSEREVVYSKWYQGRATFFSRELFVSMLHIKAQLSSEAGLTSTARTILDALEMDSPLSTKQIKALTDLQGRWNESAYNKAMKELFSKLLIVGFGEVDDGAFPSLAVGATKLIYEDLCLRAREISTQEARATLDRWMPEGSAFRKFFDRSNKNTL